jgi:hypothetical protein
MVTTPNKRVIIVQGITDSERQSINGFLESLVIFWRQSNPNEWFSIRSLTKELRGHWDKTNSLRVLKEKHISIGKSESAALKSASIDAGWLLYSVIANSNEVFETRTHIARIRQYR